LATAGGGIVAVAGGGVAGSSGAACPKGLSAERATRTAPARAIVVSTGGRFGAQLLVACGSSTRTVWRAALVARRPSKAAARRTSGRRLVKGLVGGGARRARDRHQRVRARPCQRGLGALMTSLAHACCSVRSSPAPASFCTCSFNARGLSTARA
jgi:hypothetical protein